MLSAFFTPASSHPRNSLRQRRVIIKAVFLLNILIPGVLLSSLKTINPWLSACDISHPLHPTMEGKCRADALFANKKTSERVGKLSCPVPCPLNESYTADTDCLPYLDDSRKNTICNFSKNIPKEWLKEFLGKIRLRHCCEQNVIQSLSSILLQQVLEGEEECFGIIDNLMNVDNLASRVSCDLTEVLARYDCAHAYSVHFSCVDCKDAYRRWVCASLIPFFDGPNRIRQCQSVCQFVEQACPYFLPDNRAPSLPTQYAGEPTFLCVDPNIPETPEELERIKNNKEENCCMKPCGTPKQGMCISYGKGCEGRYAIENATDQECIDIETGLSRPTNGKCPGSSGVPGSRASIMPTTYPFLVLSTLLTLRFQSFFPLLLLFALFSSFSGTF